MSEIKNDRCAIVDRTDGQNIRKTAVSTSRIVRELLEINSDGLYWLRDDHATLDLLHLHVAGIRIRLNSQKHRPQQSASNRKLGMPAHNSDSIVALEEAGAFVESKRNGEAVMINLYGTQITDDGLQHLEELAFLEKLQLRGCRNFTDAGLKHLRGLAKLEFVNLWGTPVTDIGLEHLRELSGLKTLLLGDTFITDAGLEHLKGLTNLETLDLSITRVTEEGVRQLRQTLPNCTIRR